MSSVNNEINLPKGVYYQQQLIRGVTYPNELLRGVTYLETKKDKAEEKNAGVSEQNIVNGHSIKVSMRETGNIRAEVDAKKFQVIEERTLSSLNFDLILLGVVAEVIDTEQGEQWTYSYYIEVRIYLRNGSVRTFRSKVEGKNVKKPEWVIAVTNGLATIPKDRVEKEMFQDKVQLCIETEGVLTEIVYPNPGWRNVPGYGKRYVYAGGMVGEESTHVHTQQHAYKLNIKKEHLGVKQTFLNAIAMMEICGNLATSTELMLFTHAGVMTTLFELAGYPINFVMGVIGVTNSRKTSMALAITKIFDRERMVVDAEFTATACGIEKTLGTYKDGVVIIDDFKPGVNRAQQYMLDQKLDQLVRYCGNRIAKKRMNDYQSDAEKKYFPINGVCVMTMEVVTGVTSSLSRMFLTEIGIDDVDNKKLSFYQQNAWILPTHIYDFLGWVTQHFEEVVVYISNAFPQFRDSKTFEIPRYCEMYATIMITTMIITRYASERRFWGKQESENFIKLVEQIVTNELYSMVLRIKSHDKGRVMIRALNDALISGKLSPVVLTSETAPKRFECYQNEEILFIQTRRLSQVVNQYCKEFGQSCEIINEDEAISLLQRLQVLEVAEQNGKRISSRKLPVQRGNALRYLYINKEKFMNICEE